MTDIDPDDQCSNPSANETFAEVLDARISRRSLIGGGLATVAAGSLFGRGLLDALPAAAGEAEDLLGFTPIEVNALDTVTVPEGYTARVLIGWGDPLSKGPAFKHDGSNTAAEQAQQWGMHNDGLVYFPMEPLAGSRNHGLIVQNHEYVDEGLLFPDGIASWSPEKSAKVLAAHGVSVIEVVQQNDGTWRVKRPSGFARRITGNTPIDIGGPAAGHPLLRTNADPTGRRVLGTLNNCAMGYTPWGTYLACEENFNGYFKKDAPQTPDEARYGISAFGPGNRLHTTDARFKVDTEPNEPNRFGWVVEINPFEPRSTPVKRTALGRIKHEGAWVQETRGGKVVVYSGDDQVFEYIYRFVSRLPWRTAIRKGKSPLDDGTLYVAKLHADGSGEWLPLTPDNPALAGWKQSDILIRTRQAADLAGATKMDRPEWIDTFPESLTAIATLTNNSGRGVGTNPPTDPMNPRSPNRYGHIITWSYANDWDENTFGWDIFALAGDPAVEAHGSTVVGDTYGSPDGIYVAPSGRVWIQTDVSTSTINAGAYAGFGHNQMLCADPTTKETRRFLVGPRQCEVTGVFAAPDERTLFVGIQHPGERPDDQPANPANPKEFSSWPDGDAGGRPRSSLIAITKDDGGVIGT